MESVIQEEKECYICHARCNLQNHHCLHGNANRKIADKYGLTVYLCVDHHIGSNYAVHTNKDVDLYFKRLAQTKYEELYGDRTAFIRDFGKSYL